MAGRGPPSPSPGEKSSIGEPNAALVGAPGVGGKRPERLIRRADFVAAARGVKAHREAFVLQALCRNLPEEPPRIGFTVTKKTGSAVVRNRIRRRFREAARIVAPFGAAGGCDYVVVARTNALRAAWPNLLDELRAAFVEANRRAARRGGEARSRSDGRGR